MIRVVVRFYDAVNLGDDLFVHLLATRYRNQFVVGNRVWRRSFRGLPNVRPARSRVGEFCYRVASRIRRALRLPLAPPPSADLLVYIGGSIFIEGPNPRKWVDELRFYRRLRMPYAILGANIGPFQSASFPGTVRQIAAGALDFCVRDEASYQLLADLPNTRLAPDPVLSLAPQSAPIGERPKSAIVSIINADTRFDARVASAYYSYIRSAVEFLVSDGYCVTLMSFCEAEGDLEACKRILDSLDDPTAAACRVYSYSGDIHDALSLFGSCDAVIGSRFHATILGLAFGCRTLPLSYSNKTVNQLSLIGYTGPVVDMRSLTERNAPRFDLSDLWQFDLGTLPAQAATQFAALDRLLERQTGSSYLRWG